MFAVNLILDAVIMVQVSLVIAMLPSAVRYALRPPSHVELKLHSDTTMNP
jgi:hypothetical protein